MSLPIDSFKFLLIFFSWFKCQSTVFIWKERVIILRSMSLPSPGKSVFHLMVFGSCCTVEYGSRTFEPLLASVLQTPPSTRGWEGGRRTSVNRLSFYNFFPRIHEIVGTVERKVISHKNEGVG